MRKAVEFLEPYPTVRKTFVIGFALTVASTTAALIISVISYSFFDYKFGFPESHLSVMLGALLLLWFISAMGFSISSNKEVMREKERVRAANDKLFFIKKEQRLAREALKADRRKIAANKDRFP